MAFIRIVVADGHDVVRSAICNLIEQENDMEIVAQAASGADAVRYTNGHKPDLVLIDPDSAECSNLIFQAIKEASPKSKVLVFSGAKSPRLARDAFKAGVDGYVLKDESLETLIEALRASSMGSAFVSPAIALEMVRLNDENGLTDREQQILGLLAVGFTNSETADSLYLSVRTVESHRAHICQKLDVNNRHELVMAAVDLGLVDLTGSTPYETSAA